MLCDRRSSGSGRDWRIVSFKASSNWPTPDSFFLPVSGPRPEPSCREQPAPLLVGDSNTADIPIRCFTTDTLCILSHRLPLFRSLTHAIIPFSSSNWRVHQPHTRPLCLVGDPPSRIAPRVGGRGFPGIHRDPGRTVPEIFLAEQDTMVYKHTVVFTYNEGYEHSRTDPVQRANCRHEKNLDGHQSPRCGLV